MANDRIWIHCKYCDKGKLLLKYYPTGSYVWPIHNDPEGFEDWMLEHLKECIQPRLKGSPVGPLVYYDLNGDPGFELRVESEKHEAAKEGSGS